MEAETAMLASVKVPFEVKRVKLASGNRINTLRTTDLGKPPLVLVHGWGGALGWWRHNLDGLAEKYTVYAIDLLGWGRSSRPDMRGTQAERQRMWVDSIEEWADAVGLEEFTLLGHSMGGYLSGLYALSHPERITRLVLAAAAGIIPDPREETGPMKLASKLEETLGVCPPLAMLRLVERFGMGKWLMRNTGGGRGMQEEEVEYVLSGFDLPVAGEAAAAGIWMGQGLYERLGVLKVRTDMILAELDTTIPPRLGEERGGDAAFRQLAVPGTLTVLKGASHGLYNLVDDFNRAVSGVQGNQLDGPAHPDEQAVG